MTKNKNRLLMALDGSQKAFRTISYLCNFKPFLKKELVLHNIITRIPQCYYDLRKDPSSYSMASRMMAWEYGYRTQPEKNIFLTIVKGAQSRAVALVETADKERCDTIVFGRRGISDPSGFDMGRIPWKVIHGAQHLTVWMVP